jgi:alanyl-tRNA synthetase
MEQARERSRAAGDTEQKLTLPPDALDKLKKLGVDPTRDQEKYHSHPLTATVKAIWNGRNFDESVSESSGRIVAVILDQTCFYAEQGGQVGDTGVLFEDASELPSSFSVSDTQTVGGYVLHIGQCSRGELNVGDIVLAEVESSHREPVLANHTGTHLLNHALRAVLGDDVNQKGSLVAPDRLRFDFSHTQAMTPAEIERVEKLVNDAIARAVKVYAEVVPLAQAKAIHGVRAIFGERYPDPVRVVSIGVPVADLLKQPSNPKWYDYSIEFCGGTHLEKTDEAKHLVIQHEQALAAGVRRLIALTGAAAMAAEQAAAELEKRVREAASGSDETLLNEFNEIVRHVDELPIGALAKHRITAAIDGLRERVKKLRKAAESANRGSIVDQARSLADKISSGGLMPLLIERLDGADRDSLLAAMDVLRAKLPDTACMLLSVDGEQSKISIVAAVPKDLIAKGLKAGDWVKAAATACGGSGGGKPDMAQAGGKDPAKINDAIDAARGFAQKIIP